MLINDREYRLIVPKWDNSGRKIKSEEIEEIAKRMSDHFGGVSIIPSILGCWKNEEGKLICEENLVFQAYRDSESVRDWERQKKIDEEFVNSIAKELGKRFGQESVLISEDKVEVNFVEGKYRKELPPERIGIDWFKKLV
ncbi:hypothetical protein J7L87_04885 [bacterium]|nr:hypothetical protein [bacterium]